MVIPMVVTSMIHVKIVLVRKNRWDGSVDNSSIHLPTDCYVEDPSIYQPTSGVKEPVLIPISWGRWTTNEAPYSLLVGPPSHTLW